jgi:hypothetical protein
VQQDKNTAGVFSTVNGPSRVARESQMDLAAEAEMAHLIGSGREMRAADNDAGDGWNGVKDVRNSSGNEQPPSKPRAIDMGLAILWAPLFRDSDSAVIAEEISLQFRLLLSAVRVKLNPFYRGRGRFSDNLGWDFRLARRRP